VTTGRAAVARRGARFTLVTRVRDSCPCLTPDVARGGMSGAGRATRGGELRGLVFEREVEVVAVSVDAENLVGEHVGR
jgi:hypothetical protein